MKLLEVDYEQMMDGLCFFVFAKKKQPRPCFTFSLLDSNPKNFSSSLNFSFLKNFIFLNFGKTATRTNFANSLLTFPTNQATARQASGAFLKAFHMYDPHVAVCVHYAILGPIENEEKVDFSCRALLRDLLCFYVDRNRQQQLIIIVDRWIAQPPCCAFLMNAYPKFFLINQDSEYI